MLESRPTALVTGANRGIGLALCRRLAANGRDVIAVCRQSSPALDVLAGKGTRVEAGVELKSDRAVGRLAQRLEGVRIDELICNAGILREDGLADVVFEDVRVQMEVNALAPLRTVRALSENLGKGSKVALVTSRMGSIADNSSGGYYGYRMSKAALNAAGMSLARDLAPAGVAVAILHPGYVRTEMTGFQGNVDADEAARMLIERIDALTLERTGTFWHANGEVLPW
jgi:NAD(P)-dependent dehydrogenase (short-subunit alcohol dehydrogenase family)